MLFKLHYFLMSIGFNAMGVLLGVYMTNYTKATPAEIGLLYMLMPFIALACRPVVSSYADRNQAHQKCLLVCLFMLAFCYTPYIVVPFLGPKVYVDHERCCWYFLVCFKVIGDLSWGCAATIGDSLAVNYCKRIGTDLSYYRVGGTISWMVSGIITGQLNEIWFLPKYVVGFMILVSGALLNMLMFYLWPKEYFVMVTSSTAEKELRERSEQQQHSTGKTGSSGSQWTRSLMPKEVVWSHAKSQLLRLVTCSCVSSPSSSSSTSGHNEYATAGGKQQVVAPIDSIAIDNEQTDKSDSNNKSIGKRTQLLTLLLLLRRDPRIVGYLLIFVAAGAITMPFSFFLMSLSETCHTNNTCDFSQLAGLLQVSMAITETIWIFFMKQIVSTIGRLNALSIAFAVSTIKYLFYGTIWPGVNPNYSILAEALHGIIYGTFIISMNEQGHSFALEVEHLIPELLDRGLIRSDDLASQEKLKLSLRATMQALIMAAYEGIGRGASSLIYGIIIGLYSFHTLWLLIGFGSLLVCCALLAINLLDHCVGFQLGLDGGGAKGSKLKATSSSSNN
uniref:Major facilitator superfamily associated domain-containing protein n=1 Tax=Aceria tosichella TaxID=561515 RepID=A0A6G1SB10_9ACAR